MSDRGARELALAPYQPSQLDVDEIEMRQQQADELEKKLKHIIQDIPDRTYNVMGSQAGASSSEFHTYRHSRRREQERLAQIEEDWEKNEKRKQLLEKTAQLAAEDEAKTARKRAKRMRKKQKKSPLYSEVDAEHNTSDNEECRTADNPLVQVDLD